MTLFARVRQIILWACGGAILSPYLGAPVWAMTGEDRANDALPWATLVIGASAGIVALGRLTAEWKRRGATAFSVAYPPMLSWWSGWAEGGIRPFLWFLGILGLCLGLVAVVRACPARVARELRKLAASAAWVIAILAMPVYAIGTVVLPLAISLTVLARHQERSSTSRTLTASHSR